MLLNIKNDGRDPKAEEKHASDTHTQEVSPLQHNDLGEGTTGGALPRIDLQCVFPRTTATIQRIGRSRALAVLFHLSALPFREIAERVGGEIPLVTRSETTVASHRSNSWVYNCAGTAREVHFTQGVVILAGCYKDTGK